MANQLITVIIPVKNEVNRIKSIIENLLAQTYRPIEVLFVDGGSTDGTCELVEKLAKMHSSELFQVKLLKEGDYGPLRSPANARNIGVMNSRGNYIAFFDADFELTDRDVIKKVVERLRQSEHVAIRYVPNMHTWIEKSLALDDMIYYFNGNKPVHMACAFKRGIFNWATFDATLGFHEDMEFLSRVGTRPVIVDSEVKRCYPHTLREFLKQQLWYGRTALRYYRKAGQKSWLLKVVRSNAILGLLTLSILFSFFFSVMLTLIPIGIAMLIITRRWLRKDIKLFGANVKLLERLLWLTIREILGRLFFDVGLLEALIKKRVELGR